MTQNRNKLIELFIGNLANSIVHEVLEIAVGKEIIADRYRTELTTSFDIAKKYRQKINPISRPLPDKEISYIKNKVIAKVRTELNLRISKGYTNINLEIVESLADKALASTNIK